MDIFIKNRTLTLPEARSNTESIPENNNNNNDSTHPRTLRRQVPEGTEMNGPKRIVITEVKLRLLKVWKC